jgi:hypothetical protein
MKKQYCHPTTGSELTHLAASSDFKQAVASYSSGLIRSFPLPSDKEIEEVNAQIEDDAVEIKEFTQNDGKAQGLSDNTDATRSSGNLEQQLGGSGNLGDLSLSHVRFVSSSCFVAKDSTNQDGGHFIVSGDEAGQLHILDEQSNEGRVFGLKSAVQHVCAVGDGLVAVGTESVRKRKYVNPRN